MKNKVQKRKAKGMADYIALALTTFGVGYIPGAPGTYGSALGVGIYLSFYQVSSRFSLIDEKLNPPPLLHYALIALVPGLLVLLCFAGIWASGRSISLLGDEDAPEAVVDEVIGQLVTFCFVPFGLSWPFVIAGFLLFRLFDILKPYPLNFLQNLPGGLGVCADDIVAGVYAGICLAIGYAVYLSI